MSAGERDLNSRTPLRQDVPSKPFIYD